MQEQQAATLKTTFSEVLANLAFMFADEDMAEGSSEGRWLETTITYRGPAAGTLRFRCTSAFSVMLAANLLGSDPADEDADAQGRDAVKEFMNIVCGQFVTDRHGTEHVFNLSIPEIEELAQAPTLGDGDDPDVSMLTVEGHAVQLCYSPGEQSTDR